VPIEIIDSGDEDYAFDNTRQAKGYWPGQLVSVHTQEGVVRSIRKHRFWVESSGAWMAAAELRPGMSLRNG